MRKYPVIITQGEDGWYVATCPAIPGCISQGRTISDAKRNIREAIQLCLECYEQDGKPLPSPQTTKIKVVEISV
jgi:predicted RNase H-like HicB family nuclease